MAWSMSKEALILLGLCKKGVSSAVLGAFPIHWLHWGWICGLVTWLSLQHQVTGVQLGFQSKRWKAFEASQVAWSRSKEALILWAFARKVSAVQFGDPVPSTGSIGVGFVVL